MSCGLCVLAIHYGSESDQYSGVAEREYELLRSLKAISRQSNLLPWFPAGMTSGDSLESILVTEQLKFSCRTARPFARNIREDTAERLIDALAVLMVRLHLQGLLLGDVSLSNVLFLRDAEILYGRACRCETGVLYCQPSDGQRDMILIWRDQHHR